MTSCIDQCIHKYMITFEKNVNDLRLTLTPPLSNILPLYHLNLKKKKKYFILTNVYFSTMFSTMY